MQLIRWGSLTVEIDQLGLKLISNGVNYDRYLSGGLQPPDSFLYNLARSATLQCLY